MKKSFFILLCLYSAIVNVNAQEEGLAAISQDDLKAYMEFFASDNMAGRETGTVENDISVLFIRTNLIRLGIKPVPGSNDYYQKLPLFSTGIVKKETGLKLMNSSGEVIMQTDSVVSLMPTSNSLDVNGQVVFAGYGYEDKTAGYSDFEGIDLKGKIVMIMTRNPEAVKTGAGMTVFSDKLEGMKFSSLITRTPAAIVFVYDPENSYSDPYESGLSGLVGQSSVSFKKSGGGGLSLPIIFITRHTADELLRPTGNDLKQMQQKIITSGRPVSSEIKGLTATVKTSIETTEVTAYNIIGIVEGSDPLLKKECVIYTAHFDHVGVDGNGAVFNGADDNASGSMALLEIAEAFATLPKKPLRSIIFAWVNGEEKGLLGSKYYVENPLFPLEKTVVNINLDMVGRSKMPSDTGKFYGFDLDITNPREINVITGHESSELTAVMNESAGRAGLRLNDMGPTIPYGSSDHASFTAKKIPALFFNSGIHADLHKPGDDVDKIDFDKMERSAKMCFLIGYEISSRRERLKTD